MLELFTLFSAGEVRKSLRSSGIPGVDGGNTVNYRAIDHLFLQVKYGSLSGVAEFRVWIAEIPLIIELLTLFFSRVKYGSLSGVAEFLDVDSRNATYHSDPFFSSGEIRKSLRRSGIPGVDSEIPLIIELLTLFFCR